MIEFVGQLQIKDRPIAYSGTGGSFSLRTFDGIKSKVWDYHFNHKRFWEAANKHDYGILSLYLTQRALSYKFWYYQMLAEAHITDDILGESDVLFDPPTLEGRLVGVLTAINDANPGPIGAPGLNDYTVTPYEIHAIAPKTLDLSYQREYPGSAIPSETIDIGSDSIRYIDNTSTSTPIIDGDEIVTPDYLVIYPNIRGLTDGSIVKNATAPGDMTVGQKKSNLAQVRSNLSNLRGSVIILWGRNDYIPSIGLLESNPRATGSWAFSNVFYHDDSDWGSPFFTSGSTRNKNPDPSMENPGGDWLIINGSPVLADESEVDTYTYGYTFTDIDGFHTVTVDVSVKLREYSMQSEGSRKAIDASVNLDRG